MSYPAGSDAGPGWRYRGIGLSNTLHSDIAPCLPLPSLPVFCGASDPELRLVDEPRSVTRHTQNSSDRSEILSVSSKIADLLRETDVSYLNLRVDTRQTPFGYVEPTTLHDEVVGQNPEVFNYSIPGRTNEQIPCTMHEKKPFECGALEGDTLKTHQAHKELGESRRHHLNHVTTNDISTSSKKSKVKKRVHDETPSSAGVDPVQHQDDFIGSFCEVLEDVCGRAEISGDDRDELEWLALPISDLRVLVNEIVSIRVKKLLHLVPPNILIRLLRVLGHQIHRAEGLSIDEMDPSDSDTFLSILCALESIHASLAVISHNPMPKQLYSEEIIERILEFARHQITDIMCIFDPSYRAQHKPNENGAAEGYEDDEQDVDYGSAKKRRSVKSYKMKRSAVNKVSAAANTVLQKLCTILGLLKDLLLIEKLSDSCILQLVRTSFTTLLVDNVQLLQLKAISLTSAIFYSYKQHRTYLVDEMIQLLWKLPSSKRALRTYLLPDEDQRQIQMFTALLVQLVHCSANLPEGLGNASSINSIMEIPIDTDYLTRCHEAVTEACCLFWTRVLERLTSVKAQDASEVKVMMENLVMDLMTTLNLPEYPASALILEVFCVLLLQNAGLKSKDIAGRSMAIDFLGTIAARLKRDAVISKLDKLWLLQELNDEDRKRYPKDICSVCNDGRLEKLLFTCQSCQRSFHADCMGVKEVEGPSDSWNCQFCVCRKQLMVLQSCCKTQSKENPKRRSEEKYLDRITNLEIVQQLLLNYLQDSGSAEDMHFFVRWFYLCLWYKDDPKSQQKFFYYLARLRAKSIVRDSGAYFSLTRQSVKKIALALGQYNSFSRGFDKILRVLLASLRENSPVIRAKALRAVSIIVEADPEVLRDKRVQLAVEGRFCDSAISVREAALELVGRHIASHPDVGLQYFEKVAERIKDTGVSVRKRSIKIIKDMCTSTESFAEFTSACIEIIVRVTDDESSVQDLVCKTFYDFWFDKPSRNQTQYYSDGSSVPYEVAKKTEQIVDVLRRLPHNQLLVTVIKRNLALDFLPQSTKAAGIDPASLVSVRKRCELMCKCLLEKILQVDESTGGEMEVQILPYVLVLHAFCVADPTLCAPTCDPSQFVVTLETYLKIQGENRAVAQLLESIIFIIDAVIPLLRKLPQSFVEELEQDLKNMIVQNTFLTVVHACIKCLCSVMKVAGYGSFLVEYLLQVFFKTLESHEVENKQKLGKSLFCLGLLVRYGNNLLCASSDKRVDVANSLSLFRRYLDVEDFNLKVRSLQGLGFVLIARPDFMLDKEVGRILDATLSASTDYRLKIQALQNVYEYLLDAESKMGTENGGGDSSEHQSGEGNQTVPVAAGAGDTNICGGIVQLYWDKILGRCIDLNEQVRQTALKIVEVVLRQGLVHPITCVPYLIALETDPQEMNSKLAHHLLMNMNEKYPAFFESRLGDGLQMSFMFIQVLNGGEGPGNMKGKTDGGSLAQARLGVSRIYKLIRGNRVSRNKFMSSIVRKFDNPSRNESVIPFLMYCTEIMALLPFTTPDEPLYMVYAINRIIQVRAGAIEANLKAFCSRWCPRGGTQGNGAVQHEGITQINFEAADLNGTILSYGVNPSLRYDGHMGSLDLNGGIPGMDNFEANYASPLKADGLPHPMASSEPCEMSSDDLQKIQVVCLGALALQLLLKLKRQLKIVYSLNDARCQAFSPTEPLKPGDPLTRLNIGFNVGDTRMELPLTPEEVVQRYQEFKNALREDTIDYSVYTANIKVKRAAAPRGGRGSKRAAAAATIYDDNDDDDDENWRGGGRVSGSGRKSSYRTRQQR